MQNNLDCDDENSNLNPDYPFPIWYQDYDGYGNENEIIGSCHRPVGYVDNNLDCDDSNFNINPDAEEIRGNSIDENCDGLFGMLWQDGKKWYYGGSEYVRNPWDSSSKWIKHIEECVENLINDSVLYYRVKGIKMKQGEDNVIYYRNYKSELNPNDFQSYISNILGKEVTLYEEPRSITGMPTYYNVICLEFGYTKYLYTYQDEHVRLMMNIL